MNEAEIAQLLLDRVPTLMPHEIAVLEEIISGEAFCEPEHFDAGEDDGEPADSDHNGPGLAHGLYWIDTGDAHLFARLQNEHAAALR